MEGQLVIAVTHNGRPVNKTIECYPSMCEELVDCALDSGKEVWIPSTSCPGFEQCCFSIATCGQPANNGECRRSVCHQNETTKHVLPWMEPSVAQDSIVVSVHLSMYSPGFKCCVGTSKYV